MRQFCSVAWLALTYPGFRKIPTECNVFYQSVFNAIFSIQMVWIQTRPDPGRGDLLFQQWLDETGFRRV
jgi:hypothetical protein